MRGFIEIRVIKGAVDAVNRFLKDLYKKAVDDKHGVLRPTHVLMKDGEIVGYFSAGAPGVAVVFAWLSSKEIQAREGFHLVNAMENIVEGCGGNFICFPVPESSPFTPLMAEMGYHNCGTYTFWSKEL